MIPMKYGKAAASLVATVAVAWVALAANGPIGTAGWFAIAGSVLATIATAGFANTPTNPAIKSVAQAVSIVVTGIGLLLDSHAGLSAYGIVPLLIQAAAVLGVYATPNRGDVYTASGTVRATR